MQSHSAQNNTNSIKSLERRAHMHTVWTFFVLSFRFYLIGVSLDDCIGHIN